MQLSKISNFDVERYKKQRLQEPTRRGGDRRSKNLGAIKPATVRGVLHPTSSGTVNRELAVLSHMLNKAVEWGWASHRAAQIKLLREDSGRITYLTLAQLTRLINCARQDGNRQVHAFIVIGLGTSMRPMEILSIEVANVDLLRKVIYLPKTKAGPREQPITEQLAAFLETYIAVLPKGSRWLFPSNTSKEGHMVDIRKPYRRVVEAAGLDPAQVVRHTLRHTAITHLVQSGVDLPTIKRISGHRTLQMVARYAHANGEHIGAAMNRLERRYREAG